MLLDDSYQTIENPAEGIFSDRGSKFIAYAYPLSIVGTDGEKSHVHDQVKKILCQIKLAHPRARHYCWALRLTQDRSVFRVNDDGEPSGSAGRSILNTLLSGNLTNLLVVVVRYFGGTLLGIPGLIHAYKTAALAALASASVIQKTVFDVYQIEFDYLQMDEVMRIVKESHLQIRKQIIDMECSYELVIPKMQVNATTMALEKIAGLKANYIRTE